MWNYEKRLEYPIRIKRTDARMAKAILSQFGGPDGETGAAMRYLSQRFAMPYREVMGVLTDIGTEASQTVSYLFPCAQAARAEQTGTVNITPILDAIPSMTSIPISNMLISCRYS